MQLRERFRGALLGLAAGDALGTTVEFRHPGSFAPLTDIVGGGPFGLAPGEWTDDTAMALCLAESLVEREGFDPRDQMERYLRWWRAGHLSSNGRCFDIGTTVADALRRYELRGNPFAGRTEDRYGGNGSLMRLAPVPLAFVHDPWRAVHLAGEMSRTTHGAPEPVAACRYYAALMLGALAGESKEELLGPRYTPVPGLWDGAPLADRIDALEAALWAFATTDTFADGALAAVNLGDDADTTGAIYGQLAGAYYGATAIPDPWRRRLARSDVIERLAADLLAFAAAGEGSLAGVAAVED